MYYKNLLEKYNAKPLLCLFFSFPFCSYRYKIVYVIRLGSLIDTHIINGNILLLLEV